MVSYVTSLLAPPLRVTGLISYILHHKSSVSTKLNHRLMQKRNPQTKPYLLSSAYLNQAPHALHDLSGDVAGPGTVIIAVLVSRNARVDQHVRVAHTCVRPKLSFQLLSEIQEDGITDASGKLWQYVRLGGTVRVPMVDHGLQCLFRSLQASYRSFSQLANKSVQKAKNKQNKNRCIFIYHW